MKKYSGFLVGFSILLYREFKSLEKFSLKETLKKMPILYKNPKSLFLYFNE